MSSLFKFVEDRFDKRTNMSLNIDKYLSMILALMAMSVPFVDKTDEGLIVGSLLLIFVGIFISNYSAEKRFYLKEYGYIDEDVKRWKEAKEKGQDLVKE